MSYEWIPNVSPVIPGTVARAEDLNTRYQNVVQAFNKLPLPKLSGRGFSEPVEVGEAVLPLHAVTLEQLQNILANFDFTDPDDIWQAVNQLTQRVDANELAIIQILEGLLLKQDQLISGDNIKTINGQPILGSGNIVIEASGTDGLAGTTEQSVGGIMDLSKGHYFHVLLSDPSESLSVINYPVEHTAFKLHVDLLVAPAYLAGVVDGQIDPWLSGSKFSSVVGDYKLILGAENKLTLSTFDGGNHWYVEGLFDCASPAPVPVFYLNDMTVNSAPQDKMFSGDVFYNPASGQFEQLGPEDFNYSSDGLLWSNAKNTVSVVTTVSDQITSDGLLVHYTMDNIQGAGLIDEQGNNDGVITGAVSTPGVIDDALRFDGIDDFVDLDGINESRASYTVAFRARWINGNFYPYQDKNIILRMGGLSSVSVAWNNLNGTGSFKHTGPVSLNKGQWYTIIARRNGDTGIVTLDIDDSQHGFNSSSTNPTNYGVHAHLGRTYIGDTSSFEYSECDIDQFRLYGRYLSDEEVAVLKNEINLVDSIEDPVPFVNNGKVYFLNGVYLKASDIEVYRSLNGKEWFTCGDIALNDPDFGVIKHISYSQDDSKLYLITSEGSYLRESADGGVTWALVDDSALALPNGTLRQAGGVYYLFTTNGSGDVLHSTDGGVTWGIHSTRPAGFENALPTLTTLGWKYFNNSGVVGYTNANTTPDPIGYQMIGASTNTDTGMDIFWFKTMYGDINQAIETSPGVLTWSSGDLVTPDSVFADIVSVGGVWWNRIVTITNETTLRVERKRRVTPAEGPTYIDTVLVAEYTAANTLVGRPSYLSSEYQVYSDGSSSVWVDLSGSGATITTGADIVSTSDLYVEFGGRDRYNISLSDSVATIESQEFGGATTTTTVPVAYAGDSIDYGLIEPIDPTMTVSRWGASVMRFANGTFYKRNSAISTIKSYDGFSSAAVQAFKANGQMIIFVPQPSWATTRIRVWVRNSTGNWDSFTTFFGDGDKVVGDFDIHGNYLFSKQGSVPFGYNLVSQEVVTNPSNMPESGTWYLNKTNNLLVATNSNISSEYYQGLSFDGLSAVFNQSYNLLYSRMVAVHDNMTTILKGGDTGSRIYTKGGHFTQPFFLDVSYQYSNGGDLNILSALDPNNDPIFFIQQGLELVMSSGSRVNLTELAGTPSGYATCFSVHGEVIYIGSDAGLITRLGPSNIDVIEASPVMGVVGIADIIHNEGKIFLRYINGNGTITPPAEVDPVTLQRISTSEITLPQALSEESLLMSELGNYDSLDPYPIYNMDNETYTILRSTGDNYVVYKLINGAWAYQEHFNLSSFNNLQLSFSDIDGVSFDAYQQDYIGYVRGSGFTEGTFIINLGLVDENNRGVLAFIEHGGAPAS